MNIKKLFNNIKCILGVFLFLFLFLPQVTQAGDWCWLQERTSHYKVVTFSTKSQEYIDGYKYSHDFVGDLTCNTLIPKVSTLSEQEKTFLKTQIQKFDLQDGVYKMSYREHPVGKYEVGERELFSREVNTYEKERVESISLARKVWRDTAFSFVIGIFSYTSVLWFLLFVSIFKVKNRWFRLAGLIVTTGWSIFMISMYTIGEYYYWSVSNYMYDISRLLLWERVHIVCLVLMAISIFIGLFKFYHLCKHVKYKI